MELHPRTRLRYVDDGHFGNDRGYTEFYLKDGLFYVDIGTRPFPYETRLFIEGHEEAHAAQFLGHLTRLYERLNESGLRFNFLPKEYASENDLRAKMLFDSLCYGNEQETLRLVDEYWEFIEPVKESIADAGGLLALINASADLRLIGRVKNCVHQGIHGFMPSQILIKFQSRKNPISYTFIIKNNEPIGVVDAIALQPGEPLPSNYQISDLIGPIESRTIEEIIICSD